MATINRIMLMGNVCRDLALRFTTPGDPVLNVPMAVHRRVRGANGRCEDRTAFVEVTFFGRSAEILAERLNKGDLFYCEGQIDQIERTVNAGKPNERQERKTSIIGSEFQLMPQREGRGGKHEPAPVQP